MEFKIAFNEAAFGLSGSAVRLSQLTEKYIETRSGGVSTTSQPPEDRKCPERIIRSLDQQVPHSLAEDFRNKRPIAFMLAGVPFEGTTTWSQVYETLCRHLASIEPAIFDALPTNAEFVSDRGNRYFSRHAGDLRIPRDVGAVCSRRPTSLPTRYEI